MLLSLSIRPGFAVGIPVSGLGVVVAVAGRVCDATVGAVAVLSCCSAAAAGAIGAVCFPIAGNGVVPFTTLAAEKSGTDSVSFFTRIDIRRLDWSAGSFLSRSIMSA